MEETKIIISQERDFGDIFNAAFGFIRQEFKLFGKAIFILVVPILLLSAIVQVLFSLRYTQALSNFDPYDAGGYGTIFSIIGGMIGMILLLFLFYAAAITILKCTVYGYMRVYKEKGAGNFGMNDIVIEVKKFFFPVLGSSIVVGILAGIGYIFCIIPGIYLSVSLSLIYAALIFEGKGFGVAFSRSFNLTGKKWWLTLGLIIVSYIVIYLISLILSIPGMIAGIAPMIKDIQNMSDPSSFQVPTIYYIMNSLINLITYILFVVPTLILGFHYFSIVEETEKPSLADKIDEIGENA